MLKGREIGATFAPDEIGWIDFEARGRRSIKDGTYAYATNADAIILAYAIGDGPANIINSRRPGDALDLVDLPLDFLKHHAKVVNGTAVWAAWNCSFDRAIWNYATVWFPELEPHMIIDVMAQAVASGLPPDLKMAAKVSGASDKLESGDRLIKLFCMPDSTATPQSHFKDWVDFTHYALADIEAMRGVFKRTRQLSYAEWQECWAMERINARGVGVDLSMVAHASSLATEDKSRSAAEIQRLTGSRVKTVDEVAKMTAWLLEVLPPGGREILLKREEETDENGEIVKPPKFALRRSQVQRLLAYVQTLDRNNPDYLKAERVLTIRLWGGSKTPAKFAKIEAQHVDGMLYGQYVFNGAAQTGRASSKGVQIHNLARDTLPDEPGAIDALLAKCSYGELVQAGGNDDPVSRKLSLLIRPAFVPAEGNDFVWSDWSNIEARVLPWLAGDEVRLDIFREVDRDPRVPDLYTRTAAAISNVSYGEVTKPMRQRGKVVELALGFGGGVGALLTMAAGYGMHLEEAEAKAIVERWRGANGWALRFWGRHDGNGSFGLWGAIHRALLAPNTVQRAGRIHYCFKPQYLGGSLLCVLPSGRILTYRKIKYERVEELDEDDKPTGQFSTKLRFSRGYARIAFWHGMACENVVQAVAADVLRGTLVRLEHQGALVRIHTHDEVLIEAPTDQVREYAARLQDVMRCGFDWSEGLPLMSEETVSPYYTKHEG